MSQCPSKTKSGKPCRMKPLRGEKFCFTHSESTRAAQAAARHLGGKNSSTPHAGRVETIPANINTITDAAHIVRYVLDELLIGDNCIARSRALLACFDSFAKALEIGQIEQRLTALEAKIK